MTQEQLPFLEDNDQARARREHLEAIRERFGNAYPNKFARSRVTGDEDIITAIVEKFKSYEPPKVAGARPSPEQIAAANAELNKYEVRVAGRLATPPRVMGKNAAFVHLSDGRERLQIYVRADEARAINNDTGAPLDTPASGMELFQLLDHGDFVGVAGHLFVTKTGELSVHVRELQFLAKALVPMPDKLHGISDPEIGRRQRYVDLLAAGLKVDLTKDEDETDATSRELSSREVFERRSRLITEMRRYLDAHGYIEVETPMLTPIASGAAAKPFETFHNALGIKLYARIAPELYLKRLLVGGFERVYELNRNFRNEGIGYRWNPEFTMLEFYCAYMDVNGMMDFCEAMLLTTVEKATGGTRAKFGDDEIDFGRQFERLTMKEAIVKYWPKEWLRLGNEDFNIRWLDDPSKLAHVIGFLYQYDDYDIRTRRWSGREIMTIDESNEPDYIKEKKIGKLVEEMNASLNSIDLKEIWKEAEEATFVHRPSIATESDAGHYIEELFGRMVEGSLIQPTFITDFPKAISPLSKASPADSSIAERFELYVAGMEIANGFSELNDPYEQHERFLDQVRQRERGDEEAMPMDEDYIRALSYGMPPAAGIGIGVDRLVMLLTNRRSIRDVILFPHMRPQRQAEGETEAEDKTE
jgi:lysyl-tRNA synthetase, class II